MKQQELEGMELSQPMLLSAWTQLRRNVRHQETSLAEMKGELKQTKLQLASVEAKLELTTEPQTVIKIGEPNSD